MKPYFYIRDAHMRASVFVPHKAKDTQWWKESEKAEAKKLKDKREELDLKEREYFNQEED